MAHCYLLLGANQGDASINFNVAIKLISETIGEVISTSSYYNCEPWGYESSNCYTNIALCVDTNFKALEILDRTQAIEKQLGRKDKTVGVNYTDRVLDIDLLDYNGECFHNERLTLPHPRMHRRKFALLPLADIAPNYKHPLLRLSIEEMFEMMSDPSIVEKVG